MADKLNAPTVLTLNEGNPLAVLEHLKKHLLTPRGLIGMPTETVYGLAANGLCEESVKHIFTVKGRPLTDPVILHVPDFVDALENIFDTSLYDAFLILIMAKKFSPGPITIITRGKSSIPAIVSANTMFPAVRCPSHPIAQMLLKHVGFPLAAPSANKFGHISPTSASHVISEFPNEPILILNAGTCQLGVESTVVKVEPSEGSVNANAFLREMGASYRDIADIVNAMDLEMLNRVNELGDLTERLSERCDAPPSLIRAFLSHVFNFKDNPHKISILRRGFVTEKNLRILFNRSIFPNTQVMCVDTFSGVKDVCDAPGTMLRHYAPSVPMYLIGTSEPTSVNSIPIDQVIMIDTVGEFKKFSDNFLSYVFLDGDDELVARKLYAALRDAEKVALYYNGINHTDPNMMGLDDVTAVILFNHKQRPTDLNAAILDRIMRACSGKTINYHHKVDGIEFLF